MEHKSPDMSTGRRLLILTSSSTGNNVFCTPAIHFIRKNFPEAVIDVVALSNLSAEVFAGNRDINRVHIIKSARAFDKLAKDYLQVICLNSNALKKLGRVQTRMQAVGHLVQDVHHAEQLLQFVASIFGREVSDADRSYVVDGSQGKADALLGKHDVAPDALLVNIHLGCGTTLLHGWKFFYNKRSDDKKLWPIEQYVHLGNALVNALPGVRIVITGTRNESFLAKKFTRQVPGTINLVGKTSVPDLRQLMNRASLFIAHDCGVFHIAAASEVPIVGLFGPTNHILTGPYPQRPQHTVIKKESMAEISVEEVVAAALRQIESSRKIRRAAEAVSFVSASSAIQ